MARKPIAIACQGGGSQCAFVAGALKTLLDEGVQERYRIVGLSGTSGGAINAALGWQALVKQARGETSRPGDSIMACWKELQAQNPIEAIIDFASIGLMRLTQRGFLPTYASTPSSLQFRLGVKAIAAMTGRPEYTDLRALLTKHLDFERSTSLVDNDSPVLLVGAADVLKGTFKIFSSRNGEASVDAVLASAAIPTLFPAARVGDSAYWDGIFSSNPPVVAFLRQALMGPRMIPEEIWILQVNRTDEDVIPESPADIQDRRNELAGNLSLQHELEVVDMINTLLREDALTERFRARFGLELTTTITVRFVRMSAALQKRLDYPSKLSRQSGHIDRMLADGEEQAMAFLSELRAGQAPDYVAEAAPAQTH